MPACLSGTCTQTFTHWWIVVVSFLGFRLCPSILLLAYKKWTTCCLTSWSTDAHHDLKKYYGNFIWIQKAAVCPYDQWRITGWAKRASVQGPGQWCAVLFKEMPERTDHYIGHLANFSKNERISYLSKKQKNALLLFHVDSLSLVEHNCWKKKSIHCAARMHLLRWNVFLRVVQCVS